MIELIILDVDGCLTDGKIIYTEKGDEIKAFNVKDGLAIKTWMRMGKEVGIITGRKSDIVRRRASELGIKHLYQGIKDKGTKIKELTDELGISLENVAAIGDDLNDYHMLRSVGASFAPYDASGYITGSVDTVLSRKGGDAVVREMIEKIVKEQNEEEAFLAFWQ
jgi:3-deoxy-D-manno-octulosonate 8-phosphate phosphatase (KDO 8-P phosphatase)